MTEEQAKLVGHWLFSRNDKGQLVIAKTVRRIAERKGISFKEALFEVYTFVMTHESKTS